MLSSGPCLTHVGAGETATLPLERGPKRRHLHCCPQGRDRRRHRVPARCGDQGHSACLWSPPACATGHCRPGLASQVYREQMYAIISGARTTPRVLMPRYACPRNAGWSATAHGVSRPFSLKVINGETAAYTAPAFRKGMERTTDDMLRRLHRHLTDEVRRDGRVQPSAKRSDADAHKRRWDTRAEPRKTQAADRCARQRAGHRVPNHVGVVDDEHGDEHHGKRLVRRERSLRTRPQRHCAVGDAKDPSRGRPWGGTDAAPAPARTFGQGGLLRSTEGRAREGTASQGWTLQQCHQGLEDATLCMDTWGA